MKSALKFITVGAGLALTVAISSAAPAAENWENNCTKCHGADGKGQTKMGKKLSIRDLTDATVQGTFTDDEIVKAIREGIKNKEGKLQMKPIEDLSETDAKALVPFVRALKA
jgi:cytochrome c551/c552